MTQLALNSRVDGKSLWWCRAVKKVSVPQKKWVELNQLRSVEDTYRPMVFDNEKDANIVQRALSNTGRTDVQIDIVNYKLAGPIMPYENKLKSSNKGATMKKSFIAMAALQLSAADLTPKQEKLDINDNGKIDGDDLKKVRQGELNESSFIARAAASTPVKALAAGDVESFLKSNGVSKALIKTVLDSVSSSEGRHFASNLEGSDVGALSTSLTKSLGAPTKDKGTGGTKQTQVWRMGKLGKVILTVDKAGKGLFKFNF